MASAGLAEEKDEGEEEEEEKEDGEEKAKEERRRRRRENLWMAGFWTHQVLDSSRILRKKRKTHPRF